MSLFGNETMRLIWIIYNLLFPIGFLFLLPRFLFRMKRRGGYKAHFNERFGVYDPDVYKRLEVGGWIWIHAVSVGELFVALRFMEEYRILHPDARFVLSTTTSTGHKLAEGKISNPDVLIYFPLDFPLVMKRVLNLIKPNLIVLVELELWPNLIRLARRRKIPVALINGRISDHSYRGYRKLKLFTRPLLAEVNLFCVQSENDKDRLISLGADKDSLYVLNSAKYDMAPPSSEGADEARDMLRSAGIKDDDLILLGGSTWAGEESILLNIYRELESRFHRLKLVLVPRHAERAEAVLKEIESKGFKPIRRSEISESGETIVGDVLLVDTTGELNRLYPSATVIFVGKSLTEHGGQNIIEPAMCGKPIIVGPNMENFPVVLHDFLSARALAQVEDAAGLKIAIESLLSDQSSREAMGERALQLVQKKAGAVHKTVKLIEKRISGLV